MALHRLLGFRAVVPDPSNVGGFYDEHGLTGGPEQGWSGSAGGGTVRLDEGDFRRPLSVEIGCDEERDVDTIALRLAHAGADVHRTSGGLRVIDPPTRVQFGVSVAARHAIETRVDPPEPNAPGRVTRRDARAPAVFNQPRPPRRLGHLVLGTPDIAATRDLLVDGLGCKISDELPGIIAFLRCSPDHHNIALVESVVPLLQHYSWECDDVDHVGHAATALLRVDAKRHAWGLGRHFAGSNYYWYLRDPAGSFLELYSDMDRIEDDVAWEARGRTPFDLAHIANSWGPDIPLEFIEPHDLEHLQQGWASVGGT